MTQKNEPPTPKKIRDARKKGNVPHSKELVSASNFVVVTCFLMLAFDLYIEIISANIKSIAHLYSMDIYSASAIIVKNIFDELFITILPILGIVVSVSILMTVSNIGFLFTLEKIKPDLNKLNPVQVVKKIFSKRNLIELIKSCCKILFLGFILYHVIIDSVLLIINSIYCGLSCILSIFKMQIWKMIIYTDLVFIFIALADVAYQRWDYIRNLRMSKEEIRKEYKETEGDPIIKSKRKQLHKEILMQNMAKDVKKSAVVITNPTHLAVALYYDSSKPELPIVYIKGQGDIAKYIVKIAMESNILVTQNIPIARALYKCDVMDYIPSDLIIPIAEIIKWSIKHKIANDNSYGSISD